MRKGFFFSLTVILLFTILLLMAYTGVYGQSADGELTQIRTMKKLSAAWWDVNDNFPSVLQLSVTRQGQNVTFSDFLPAPTNITQQLIGYEKFVSRKYSTGAANASFSPPLASLNPPLQISPFGINYTYPDWGKSILTLACPSGSGCDAAQGVVLALSVNYTFSCNPMNASNCTGSDFKWAPAPGGCTLGASHCVSLTLNITDVQNHTYSCPSSGSQVGCAYSTFDYSTGQKPKLTVNFLESSSCSLQFRLSGGNLFDLQETNAGAACGTISSNVTLDLNATPYSLPFTPVLTVRNEAGNQSIGRALSS